jgi:rhodanese-related sulfurtransferase
MISLRSTLLICCALALAACEEERTLPQVDYSQVSEPAEVRAISAIDLAAKIQAGEVLLIDVRDPAEFAERRIAGALNAPFGQFDTAMIPREDVRETIFYCRAGDLSKQAAEQMAERFGGTVRYLDGGITDWASGGRETISQSTALPPAEEPSA